MEVTGIAWTDATVNFVIGCQHAGPGCDDCYAAALALRRWDIRFEPGGERRVTKSGFLDPLRWNAKHERGETTMRHQGRDIPVPVWVFACSLSDFFDRAWPAGVRDRAWAVIRQCRHLRWQIVTKRIGNAAKMLPADWDGGRNYPHVGFIATMVNQNEVDRDMPKLRALKLQHGVKWIGLSIEPQIGFVDLTGWLDVLDWVITGGESKNAAKQARPYDLSWANALIYQCVPANVPVFVKQLGDNPVRDRQPLTGYKGKGDRLHEFPASVRVQQMPRIYDGGAPHFPAPPPERCTETTDLFTREETTLGNQKSG